MLETLISSKTRVKLLLKFFLNSSNSSYLRGLESEFGESTNAIRLELNKFESAGLLTSDMQGNKKMFKANVQHPLYHDINSILLKFTGLDKVVDHIVSKLGELSYVYVIGNLAKGLNGDIIDLIFIGDIDRTYLLQLIEKVEDKISKKIKYVSYSNSEISNLELGALHKDLLLLWSK